MATARYLPANRFLLGHLKMLRNLPANRQFNVSVDAHIDNHRAVFDGKSLVNLAEIVGPIDSESLGAKANGEFFEIRLGDFGIFRRQPLVNQIMPLLPDGIVVEHENGERQVMTDRGVEIGYVHDERGIRCEMGNALARSRKAGAQCDAQALPNGSEVQSERPIVGAGAAHCLAGHHCRVAAVEDENAIPFRQLFFQIAGGATRIDPLAVVVTYRRRLPLLELRPIDGPIEVFGVRYEPIMLIHGETQIYGYRFGSAAYLTDHSEIPESSLDQLHNLDILFLDALRHKPHPTHSTVENSLQVVEHLKPRRAFFTHICHDLPHQETNASLPENVRLSYDGMKLEFDI